MPVDDAAFLASLDAMRARIEPAMMGAAAKIGGQIVAKSMANAPVRTGTLRRSIQMEGPVVTGLAVAVKVAPTIIYARRIELGFMNMRDSLGRLYHQHPHYYFAPAVLEVVAQAPGIIEEALLDVIG